MTMHLLSAVAITAFLIPLSCLAACPGGSCAQEEEDQTSLMQIGQSLSHGNYRVSKQLPADPIPQAEPPLADESLDDVQVSESDIAAPAVQEVVESDVGDVGNCQVMACFGYDGPACSGSEVDCTSQGYTVKAYTTEADAEQCPSLAGQEACSSGQVVICEKCTGPTLAPPTSPAPPTPPPPPVYPTTTTAKPVTPGPTPTPEAEISVEGPSPAKLLNVTESDTALKDALGDVGELKKVLANITKLGDKLAENVSKASSDIEKYTIMATEDRAAAVRFAKDKALANQSLARAKLAMDDAITGEKAASNAATVEAAKATNAAEDKVHYKKMLIDQEQAEQEALDKLHVGRVAVHRAFTNFAIAKGESVDKAILSKHRTALDEFKEDDELKRAKITSVKDDMEDAFVASSLDRKLNNTPLWGEHPQWWQYWKAHDYGQ